MKSKILRTVGLFFTIPSSFILIFQTAYVVTLVILLARFRVLFFENLATYCVVIFFALLSIFTHALIIYEVLRKRYLILWLSVFAWLFTLFTFLLLFVFVPIPNFDFTSKCENTRNKDFNFETIEAVDGWCQTTARSTLDRKSHKCTINDFEYYQKWIQTCLPGTEKCKTTNDENETLMIGKNNTFLIYNESEWDAQFACLLTPTEKGVYPELIYSFD